MMSRDFPVNFGVDVTDLAVRLGVIENHFQ